MEFRIFKNFLENGKENNLFRVVCMEFEKYKVEMIGCSKWKNIFSVSC